MILRMAPEASCQGTFPADSNQLSSNSTVSTVSLIRLMFDPVVLVAEFDLERYNGLAVALHGMVVQTD